AQWSGFCWGMMVEVSGESWVRWRRQEKTGSGVAGLAGIWERWTVVSNRVRLGEDSPTRLEEERLQATANFKADHVDAYDSDCDDKATENAIFMENLSHVGSISDDMVEPCYDYDIHSEVPHYDTYHEPDVLKYDIQELEYIENTVFNNESYDELTSNSNVIYYVDYMVTVGNDEDNYIPPPIQNNDRILFVTEHMKTQVEKCNMIVEIVLWYLDFGRSKHMIGNHDKRNNFVFKFIGMVRFGNNHFTDIMGYEDLHMGNILISRVYYVEGLCHNLFSVGQVCNLDLEVAFGKHTGFIRNLEGVDLLLGSRGSNLYTILMANMIKSYPICLLSKASKTKSWLWNRQLSHLNFATMNQLAKQDIGIFICYSPSKKAYRIYNRRTRQIMETTNIQFDELSQMASEQHGSGLDLQGLTFGHISSGLVLNHAASTSVKPPIKNDYFLMFQPMFDKYFKP
nr:integrase, catalytic region, zinc finger, CCHC-type, peptidase aspartic, catalytic [Tanacetum cinerariifolium]